MTGKYPCLRKFGLAYYVSFYEEGDLVEPDKLEASLQSLYDWAPTVYGSSWKAAGCTPWVTQNLSTDTRTAKLMFIEEIKKAEPCKHEVSMSQAYGGPLVIHSNDNRGMRIRITCCKCGVEVKPTWESAE